MINITKNLILIDHQVIQTFCFQLLKFGWKGQAVSNVYA